MFNWNISIGDQQNYMTAIYTRMVSAEFMAYAKT